VVLLLPLIVVTGGAAFGAPGDPNVTITSPTANQRLQLASHIQFRGAATDNSGVTRAAIALRRTDTGRYLQTNGTWGTSLAWLNASTSPPGGTSVSWTYTWAAPFAGSFSLTAQAWDAGNRSDTTRPTVNFSVSGTPADTTRPTVTITTPTANQALTMGTITPTGAATDNVAVTAVEVSLRNTSTGLYYQPGGTWASTAAWHSASIASASASTTWSWSWNATAAGSFSLTARSRDAAGNVSTAVSRSFSVVAGGGGCTPSSPPYGVGTMTLSLVDQSRGRSLPTTVYYPSAAGTSGANAPAACGPFPLVMAGHGGSGTGDSAAQIHRYLAVNGYVLVAPTFPAGFDYTALTADVRFVITEVLSRSAGTQAPLAGLVNADRIGFIGTSKGAMIGLALYQACCHDSRIDAIVSKIGVAPSGTYDWPGGPPLLMINGDADTTAPYSQALQNYNAASPPKGLIRLAGVDHTLNVGSSPILQETSLGFFGYFLKGDSGGLARVQAAVDALAIASMIHQW
jgi:hypothetical protein